MRPSLFFCSTNGAQNGTFFGRANRAITILSQRWSSMLTSGTVLLQIVFRTAVVYAIVLLGVRLAGKWEVGQMTPFDLVLLLLLSNSVQNAMTGPDTSVMGGAAAAATLLALNYLLAEVARINRRFRKFIQGQPSLLVHDGQIITAHMSRE